MGLWCRSSEDRRLKTQARTRDRAQGHGWPDLLVLRRDVWGTELRARVRWCIKLWVCAWGAAEGGSGFRGHAGFSHSEGSVQLQTERFPPGEQTESWVVAQESKYRGIGGPASGD